jgi:hypothetical protein
MGFFRESGRNSGVPAVRTPGRRFLGEAGVAGSFQ